MSFGRRLKLAITGFALPLIMFAFTYAAQNGSARQVAPQPVYHLLFPIPTGNNGYEEFAMAEDLFTSSAVFVDSERVYGDASPGSIDAKRKLIADPVVRSVFGLLHAGLMKRIHSPRAAPFLYTLIPELRDFRAIARLMCAQMEVLFADGKTSDAIDCLDAALKFGQGVQVGTMMSGVIGMYIQNTVLDCFGSHFSELPAPDCKKLARVTRRQLDRSDPQISLLNAERDMFVRTLENSGSDTSALLDRLDPGPNVSKSTRKEFLDVCLQMKENPNAGREVLDRAVKLATSQFAELRRQVKLPQRDRSFKEPSDLNSPESKLIFALFPSDYSQLSNRFANERFKVQALAVEAKIVGYLRLRDHLPKSLNELSPASLMIDPFSGGQLGFESSSPETFMLSSVGPYDAGDSKHVASGKRVSISVVFPPRR